MRAHLTQCKNSHRRVLMAHLTQTKNTQTNRTFYLTKKNQKPTPDTAVNRQQIARKIDK